ncbi:MAG: molybdopterin-guanine dinucleotide biosynthesis protein B, partial [Planctomycetales bacterium]|nr:molybdopterin-guanine dinucleotide biosynthesis protein B [Planctomycetales bacterium]
MTNSVPRVHIVGRKNSGKTTLVCQLVAKLSEQGYRVATVKHTHHQHELDTPGKDSHKHRSSGATAVGIVTPDLTAVFVPRDRSLHSDDREMRYRTLDSAFSGCDVVLVEGDLHTTAPRVEVWRKEITEQPYATKEAGIAVVVSDDFPLQTA